MKLLMRLSFAFILIFMLHSPAVANEKAIFDVLAEDSLDAAPEKNEILTMLQARGPEIVDPYSCFGNQKIKVRVDKAVKTHYLSDMLTKAFRSGKKVEDLISDKHQWYMPVENLGSKPIGSAVVDKGISLEEAKKSWGRRSWSLTRWIMEYEARKDYFKMVEKRAGKWLVSMVGMSPMNELEFISNEKRVNQVLAEAGISNPSAIKYIKGVGRFTDILYIKQGNEEYGIPLGGRPDFTGLQNGKVYSIAEIVNVLEKTTESQPYQYKRSWFEILFEYDWIFLSILIASVIVARKLYLRINNLPGAG